jgi:hypothetical protein
MMPIRPCGVPPSSLTSTALFFTNIETRVCARYSGETRGDGIVDVVRARWVILMCVNV